MPKRKRGNSEGSIYQMMDGRWRAAVSLGSDGTKRLRKVFTGCARADVAGQLARALNAVQDGSPLPSDRKTVGQYMRHWLEHVAKRTVRPKTYESYEGLVRLHILPKLGSIPLTKLTPQHLRDWLREKATTLQPANQPGKPDRMLSGRTCQYLHAVIRRALNVAVKDQVVSRNVAFLIDTPKFVRKDVTPLMPEQARAFLEAIKGDRLEALYLIAIPLGLRQGEALALQWSEIDLKKATMSIRYSLQRGKDGLQRVELKTEKSRRTLALPKVTVEALTAHLDQQADEQAFVGSLWQETGYVFTTGIGTPLDARNVTKGFQRHLKNQGLPRFRFHDTRHTAASFLIAQGVHPRFVMGVLGHSQISLTMNLYGHLMPKMSRDAADKMDAMLQPVATRLATKQGRKKAKIEVTD